MFNDIQRRAAALIEPGMEVITRDGRRAGYVATISTAEFVTRSPEHRISLDYVRRVDDDVYISLRAQQLIWD
jgi:hypothetical protein